MVAVRGMSSDVSCHQAAPRVPEALPRNLLRQQQQSARGITFFAAALIEWPTSRAIWRARHSCIAAKFKHSARVRLSPARVSFEART